MAWQVKHALGQDKPFWAVVVVNATSAQGNRRDFTSHVDLKWACLAKAGNQFTQAEDTPFLQPPFVGETGYWSKVFDEVLVGTFKILDNCDLYVKKLLTITNTSGSTTITPTNESQVPKQMEMGTGDYSIVAIATALWSLYCRAQKHLYCRTIQVFVYYGLEPVWLPFRSTAC